MKNLKLSQTRFQTKVLGGRERASAAMKKVLKQALRDASKETGASMSFLIDLAVAELLRVKLRDWI